MPTLVLTSCPQLSFLIPLYQSSDTIMNTGMEKAILPEYQGQIFRSVLGSCQ